MSEEDVVILTDEEGKEVRFLHIMTFDFEDSFYGPDARGERDVIEPGEVLLLEIMKTKPGTTVLPVEDEARWTGFGRSSSV